MILDFSLGDNEHFLIVAGVLPQHDQRCLSTDTVLIQARGLRYAEISVMGHH